jgi:hypothetical protein
MAVESIAVNDSRWALLAARPVPRQYPTTVQKPRCINAAPSAGAAFPGGAMRRYTVVSGIFLTVLAMIQITRLALQWPVRVATYDVPMWPSAVAALIAGSLAIWAFRVSADRG